MGGCSEHRSEVLRLQDSQGNTEADCGSAWDPICSQAYGILLSGEDTPEHRSFKRFAGRSQDQNLATETQQLPSDYYSHLLQEHRELPWGSVHLKGRNPKGRQLRQQGTAITASGEEQWLATW